MSLSDDDQPVVHFEAPSVSKNSILRFNLLVEDENGGIGKNSTTVTVLLLLNLMRTQEESRL